MPEKPETKYLVVGTELIPVVVISENWVVPASQIIEIRPETSTIFDNKEDGNYYKMVKKLDSGVSIDNYKSSRYFGFYMERLKDEHPEHVI